MTIIGHRGAAGLAPENTLASIKKAVEHKVDWVEFDLRVTHDGQPVLHHGPYLKDSDGRKLKIADHTYAELREHKSDLITFSDMLAEVGRGTPFYVEVKIGEPLDPIVAVLRQFLKQGWQATDFILASKGHRTLEDLHLALPDTPCLVIEPWSSFSARSRADEVHTKRIAMNQRWLWPGFIRAMSRGGWELYAYTLNNPRKARRWAKAGLAGVITDYPDMFDKHRD